eukprot:CAMPEP_0182418888 /NCGR_PEP_ID=MMETSP1167-20130531/3265_1 /TAXON_ID=2988 /ORGANISM="Mallomonas Sp, Strain CCMP3275" /LENGTH=200 /DNA_ID=CAMNT_0024593349 /DNA_START=510 /DNA_END=1109 /DNA_ORIENTATION=-
MPSSALYFGAYEQSKRVLYRLNSDLDALTPRQAIHMASAAMGNICSSLVFVPKEVMKQQMQVIRTGALSYTGIHGTTASVTEVAREIFRTKGVKGFYSGYRATLSRNIPSAVVRFTLYEELRTAFLRSPIGETLSYVLAGAIASATSSALMTPFDVVKTRIATGVIKVDSHTSVLHSIVDILRKEGFIGMYSGVQARIVW